MKKVFLIVLAAIALSSTAFAQKAIGLRFGGGSVTNFEVSYQQPMNANRLELDFGLATGNESLNLSVIGIYHWKFNIVNALDWYVGPGVAAGLYLSFRYWWTNWIGIQLCWSWCSFDVECRHSSNV